MKRKSTSRRNVRRYADIARAAGRRPAQGRSQDARTKARAMGYAAKDLRDAPGEAVAMGLGCGNPLALAELAEGQVVLDLGSGGGLDAFIAARKVGPRGRVIGVDATPEMIDKAKRFAAEERYGNIEFRLGRIEHLPLADQTVDVVISNCVINHAADKAAVFREAYRVLRPDGRLCVSDLVLKGIPPPPGTPGLEIWADWLAAASGKQEYLEAIRQAGFRDLTTEEIIYTGPAVTDALRGKISRLNIRASR